MPYAQYFKKVVLVLLMLA